MNTYQSNDEHYNALMALCAREESPFYFVDQMLDGVKYRVFTYRLAKYSDFLLPYARECRGHMFRLDENEKATLVCMTPTKFFNAEENPFTMGLDYSNCAVIMDKMDGSLISSFLHKNSLYLKSKTSFESEMAQGARELLDSSKYTKLKAFVQLMAVNEHTVNMEITGPKYRIVLPYQTDALTVLNVRSNLNGQYLGHARTKELMQKFDCVDCLVKNHADVIDDHPAFVASIAEMRDCEGFVIEIAGGETVKIKNTWYCSLHQTKDNVVIPRRLYEGVVNEVSDDLRAMFHDDTYCLGLIDDMEDLVRDAYRQIDKHAGAFFRKNGHLDRKSYAILAQTEVPQLYRSTAMNLYLGKEINYKEFLIKHYKEFGIKDDVPVATVE